ncbi:MAG TPA: NAD-dependent epimerase/dehydratase family protein [Rhodothermales bacterium]
MVRSILITGGAGFIGCNLAARYLKANRRVIVLDNFSRHGSHANVRWLRRIGHGELTVVRADVRIDRTMLAKVVEEVDVVFHLAAQVAVTTSVVDPREDFDINALGTLNVLEAVRHSSRRPIVMYSSTNKVYGRMDVAVVERNGRYAYAAGDVGIPEVQPLDFHSPYGCSKGCGDQYVVDYARTFGLRTVVFRQSCIYGPHQHGMEDQGWIAWFALRCLRNEPVVIYGDGKQVRDVLFVSDLVSAYTWAVAHIDRTAGEVYNIGGGPANTLSLNELIVILEQATCRPLRCSFDDWRPGDQRVFISDVSKAREHFGWEPRVGIEEGISRLLAWLSRSRSVLRTSNGVPTA